MATYKLGTQKLLFANIDNINTTIYELSGYDAKYSDFTPDQYESVFGISLADVRSFIHDGSPLYTLYKAGITKSSVKYDIVTGVKTVSLGISGDNGGWIIATRAGGGEGEFVYCNTGINLVISTGSGYSKSEDIYCSNRSDAAALYQASSEEEHFSRTVDIYCLACDKSKNLFFFRVRVDASGHLYEDFTAIDQQRVVKLDDELVTYCKDLIEAGTEPVVEEPWIMSRFSPRVATSGIGVYPLTTEQVTDLMQDLWSKSFTEAFNQLVLGNPMNSILSLRWFYGFTKDDLKLTAKESYVFIGNVPFTGPPTTESTISTKPCASEFASKTLTIHCPEKYNNYLDLEPYTKIQLWIPFAGWKELNPNEVMGSDIDLEYNVNLVTGACSCNIYVRNNPRMELSGIPIANVNCEMSMDIPVTVDSMKSSLLVGATVAAKVTSIGFAGGFAAGGVTTELATANAGINRAFEKSPMEPGIGYAPGSTEVGATVKAVNRAYEKRTDVLNKAPLEIAGAMGREGFGHIGNIRPSFNRSSGMSSETANLNIFRPMLLITRPKKLTPSDIADYYGSKSVKSIKLSECSGYTQVGAIKSVSDVIPGKYMNKIEALLKSGIFIN